MDLQSNTSSLLRQLRQRHMKLKVMTVNIFPVNYRRLLMFLFQSAKIMEMICHDEVDDDDDKDDTKDGHKPNGYFFRYFLNLQKKVLAEVNI